MALPTREQALQAVRTLLAYLDTPTREGLLETPERVITAWENDWGKGYRMLDPATILKTFDACAEQPYDQMVAVKNINLFSHCEHHATPFYGVAHIAYVPGPKGLVGLSKLARIVDLFARRLQTQERISMQVADCLAEHLSEHVGVMIEATHMCMVSRGVMQPNARTVTSALRGDFRTDQATRTEFLQLVGKQ